MRVHITSFGHLHGPRPQDADITLDLRPFRDPHFDPALRELTARDRRVIKTVLTTPGIRELIAATVAQARAYAAAPAAQERTLHIAVGCSGGRHRAGVTAHVLGRRLARRGHTVTVVDRDLHRPVVDRPAPQ
ncbi:MULTISPECIES: RapZ C-terminal domain-containing protein [unclassified Streptomyces]|uniref:RapZ C-terminal domain-containing protein n=1 Tax=unclassified Streptomyces TaxID=2593676 RepID=UPI000BACB05D|nr:RNase adapter RapZ [Streptomyces sp. CLI2509]ASY37065.1 ATPase [Streptomyces sp. CLI2509]MYX22178.1 ATPase [Streptomyces sp. SID8380]